LKKKFFLKKNLKKLKKTKTDIFVFDKLMIFIIDIYINI